MGRETTGFKVINERFNSNEFRDKFIKIVEVTQQNLSLHRKQNFTGSMLLHHTLQSTKFMSKWIEEKNKN